MKLLGRCLDVIRRIEFVAVALSAVAVFAIMAIICVDVAGRYLFSAPVMWSFDLISIYLMGASFYWALSDTLRRRHHITVNIVFKRFPRRVRLFLLTVGWGCSSALFVTIFLLAAERTRIEWLSGNVMGGSIHWPTWVSLAIATSGFFIIGCRLVLGAVAYGLMLFTGLEASEVEAQVQETAQEDSV